MHVFVRVFLNDLLDVLVGRLHVGLVLALDMQIEFSASNWRLLAWLHLHAPQRYRAVVFTLDLTEEVLAACSLPGCCWVVIYFEIV